MSRSLKKGPFVDGKLLKRIEADLKEAGVVEQWPKLEGRQMIMILGPKKKH